MQKKSQLEELLPNKIEGHHQRTGERIERRTIVIGNGKYMDFISDCTLIECDIRILCGANSVNLFGSTFERCTFRPRRELKNLRFTTETLRECTFLGKYTGCRFGKELDEQTPVIHACDFSKAALFHLCDFCDGAELDSMRWPSWPHILVTDLPRSRSTWLALKLPEEMRVVQRVIGRKESRSHAVSLYLPAETERASELRDLLAAQSYIIIA